MTIIGTKQPSNLDIEPTVVYECDAPNCHNTIETTIYASITANNWGVLDGKHYCPIHNHAESIGRVPLEMEEGLQTHIDVAFHRLDPQAMLILGEVLGFGEAKYQYKDVPIGQENWRKISHLDHLNHALNHIFHYMLELQNGPDPDDDEAGQHLDHALCRLMFAKGVPYGTETR
jgi:hypothetical protein